MPAATARASSCGVRSYSAMRHRERERDPAAEPPRIGPEVAVDDLRGERPARAIEPGDAEQAQDRALLADGRRARPRSRPRRRPAPSRARARASRSGARRAAASAQYGWRGRARREPATAGGVRAPAGQASGGSGAVRATWPTQTCAVGEPLRLPDRRPRLRLVDRVARRRERGVPVRRDGDHDHATPRPAARRPERWTIASRADAEPRLDLVGDLPEHAHAPWARTPRTRARRRAGPRVARPPPPARAPASRASRGSARRTRRRPRPRPSRAARASVCRRGRAGTGPRGSRGSAAGPSSGPAADTGGMHATSSPSARAVSGSAYVPLTANRSEARPGASAGTRPTTASQASSTVAPSGTSTAQLAHARGLALHREQPDADPERRQQRSRRPSDQQPGAEVQPRGEDRARGDRARR